jgi:hypothetical protein
VLQYQNQFETFDPLKGDVSSGLSGIAWRARILLKERTAGDIVACSLRVSDAIDAYFSDAIDEFSALVIRAYRDTSSEDDHFLFESHYYHHDEVFYSGYSHDPLHLCETFLEQHNIPLADNYSDIEALDVSIDEIEVRGNRLDCLDTSIYFSKVECFAILVLWNVADAELLSLAAKAHSTDEYKAQLNDRFGCRGHSEYLHGKVTDFKFLVWQAVETTKTAIEALDAAEEIVAREKLETTRIQKERIEKTNDAEREATIALEIEQKAKANVAAELRQERQLRSKAMNDARREKGRIDRVEVDKYWSENRDRLKRTKRAYVLEAVKEIASERLMKAESTTAGMIESWIRSKESELNRIV